MRILKGRVKFTDHSLTGTTFREMSLGALDPNKETNNTMSPTIVPLLSTPSEDNIHLFFMRIL